MRTYTINGEDYVTICSVHDKILNIFNALKEIGLHQEIIKEIENGIELVKVAKEMGQNMEAAIKYKNTVDGTLDFYSFQKYIESEDE